MNSNVFFMHPGSQQQNHFMSNHFYKYVNIGRYPSKFRRTLVFARNKNNVTYQNNFILYRMSYDLIRYLTRLKPHVFINSDKRLCNRIVTRY